MTLLAEFFENHSDQSISKMPLPRFSEVYPVSHDVVQSSYVARPFCNMTTFAKLCSVDSHLQLGGYRMTTRPFSKHTAAPPLEAKTFKLGCRIWVVNGGGGAGGGGYTLSRQPTVDYRCKANGLTKLTTTEHKGTHLPQQMAEVRRD